MKWAWGSRVEDLGFNTVAVKIWNKSLEFLKAQFFSCKMRSVALVFVVLYWLSAIIQVRNIPNSPPQFCSRSSPHFVRKGQMPLQSISTRNFFYKCKQSILLFSKQIFVIVGCSGHKVNKNNSMTLYDFMYTTII